MKLFKSKPAPQAIKKLNLRRRLVPWMLILLSAFVLVFVYQSDWKPPEQPNLKAKYASDARAYAKQFAKNFSAISRRLDEIALAPGLASRLQDHGSELLTQYDEELPQLFSLRLIGKNATRVDDGAVPELSYACFDMVVETAIASKPVFAEAHQFGNDRQHIDFVRPIKKPDGEVIGAVLASFNIGLLQNLMPTPTQASGYFELQQLGKALVKAGQAGERSFQPYKARVKGTRWHIAYWPATHRIEQAISYASYWLMAVGGIALLILVIAVYLATRDWLQQRRLAAEQMELEDSNVSTDSMLVDDELGSDIMFQSGEGLMVVDEIGEVDKGSEKTSVPGDVSIPALIFKAYDIRGIVGETLTEDYVYVIGQALGSEARARGQQTVVIGRDGRLSGPALISRLADGLRAAGVDVISVGLVSTPILYYAAQKLGTGSGIMLTGSHNPPNYNGLKMVIDGTTLAQEDIQNLRKRIEARDFETGEGSFEEKTIIQEYLARVTGDVMLIKKFRVVVDCGNGAAGVIAPQLFKALGCEVIELYSEVDGNFPNHHPDPGKPENLQDVIAAVKQHDADLGLAFDGDGDRLGLVTKEGRIIYPDRIMMLYAIDILSRNPGAEIIYDVKCSRNLAKVIEEHGGKATMWMTGHSLIKAKMKESGALLAGEMSGHLFFKERWYGFDDATYAAARLLELLGPMTADKTVSEVFNSLPDSVNTPEINITMAEGKHHEFMKKLVAQATFENAKVTLIDGLRADFADGWGLVRASNTTPVLVLRFEADTDAALARIMASFRDKIHAVDPDLNLSF